jgi:hypothetical protein
MGILHQYPSYYTITILDLGRRELHIFGKRWSVLALTNRVAIQPEDVGRRVWPLHGALQIESVGQMDDRLGGNRAQS